MESSTHISRRGMPLILRAAALFAAAFAIGSMIVLAVALLGFGSWQIGGDAVDADTFTRLAGPLLAITAVLMVAVAYGFYTRRSWSRVVVVILWLCVGLYCVTLGSLGLVRSALAWRGAIQAAVLLVVSAFYLYGSTDSKLYFSEARGP